MDIRLFQCLGVQTLLHETIQESFFLSVCGLHLLILFSSQDHIVSLELSQYLLSNSHVAGTEAFLPQTLS